MLVNLIKIMILLRGKRTGMEKKNNDNLKNELKEKNKKESWWQVLKFTLFSLSAGIIQILSFTLMYEVIGWNSWWACHLISLGLSVVWNFTFNRKFTFKSSNNVPIAMLLVLVYYLAFTPISVFGGEALEKAGWNGLLVEALMMIINFVTEFVWQKFVVFNRKIVPDRKKIDFYNEEDEKDIELN